MPVHRRVTPSIKFAGTHLYTWVERGTVRVKCLAQEHNTMSRPGLEPGPLYPEMSALTMRPPRLPHQQDKGVQYFENFCPGTSIRHLSFLTDFTTHEIGIPIVRTVPLGFSPAHLFVIYSPIHQTTATAQVL